MNLKPAWSGGKLGPKERDHEHKESDEESHDYLAV